VKGVLLKDILEKSEIDAETLKCLVNIILFAIASDNYKVVFSWNEIFNRPQEILFIYLRDTMENRLQHWTTGSLWFLPKIK
jgi:hypothetical protein